MKKYEKEEKVVLLQGYEALFIASHPQGAPRLLLGEIKRFLKNQTFDGTADSNQFNCVISEPQNIEWIMNQNWIVNFEQFCELRPDELSEIISNTKDEFLDKIADFNAQDKAFRDENFAAVGELIEQKRHQVLSLELMLQYLKGEVSFTFSPVEEPIFPVYYDVFKDDDAPSSEPHHSEPHRSRPHRSKRRKGFFASIFHKKTKRHA